ncbi:hypothetical protein J6590_046581 [Homalodisca vitripennis]|nr:hypothetical protein J6590_046581 [Homalodisca vitripennis]
MSLIPQMRLAQECRDIRTAHAPEAVVSGRTCPGLCSYNWDARQSGGIFAHQAADYVKNLPTKSVLLCLEHET